MSERREAIGLAVFLVTVLLVAAGLVLALAPGHLAVPANADDPWPLVLALSGISLPFAVVGALVVARRPENAIGLLFSVVAVVFGIDAFAAGWATNAAYGGGLPGAGVAVWVTNAFVPLPLFIGPLFLLLLFPDGHLLSPRWRPAAWAVAALAVLVTIAALHPGHFDGWPTVENPFAIGGELGKVLNGLYPVLDVLAAPLFVLCGLCLFLRLRRSRGRERLQIKWVVYAASMTAAAFALNFTGGGLRSEIAFWVGLASLAGIPAAAGLAIMRYRLYEIDRLINRTLVYVVLTATLAGAYLGSVLLLELVLDPVTSGSSLSVAVSTLAVAALFRPARARIQAVVNRRFYRQNYDAGLTLERFSARLRHEVDLDALGAELRAVVTDTMQPAHVSLWVRPPPLRRP